MTRLSEISMRDTARVRARLQLMTKADGGRHTPVFDQYRPDFRASTGGHGDVDLGVAAVTLPADSPMLMPVTEADVELEPVDLSAWANVTTGLVLGVFEEGRQVGTATVLPA
jgi:elongation factor Tu